MGYRIGVLVMGDLGRSPRMGFHALSCAEQSNVEAVYFIGYRDSALPQQIANHPRIRPISIRPPPDVLSRLPSLMAYAMKLMWITVVVMHALFMTVGRLDMLIMQNPPALPALAVVWLHVKCWCKRVLVVDWHNYSYSVLQASLEFDKKTGVTVRDASNNNLVRLTRAFESSFGARADISFCVTRAMRADLLEWVGVDAVPLHDRPPTWKFPSTTTTVEERHELMRRLSDESMITAFGHIEVGSDDDEKYVEKTRFTRRHGITGNVELRPDRPALLISSTSWTVDEDFGILLAALQKYDERVVRQRKNMVNLAASKRLPSLVAVITGRGPQKAGYLSQIAAMHLSHVEIVTPWLTADDYPLMMRCADLGVSLHTSTSGLDLPMKVVDMLGSGVPALSCQFEAIGELVEEKVNGRIFKSEGQLGEQLGQLFAGYPKYSNELCLMRDHIRENPMMSWEKNWMATAWVSIEKALFENIK